MGKVKILLMKQFVMYFLYKKTSYNPPNPHTTTKWGFTLFSTREGNQVKKWEVGKEIKLVATLNTRNNVRSSTTNKRVNRQLASYVISYLASLTSSSLLLVCLLIWVSMTFSLARLKFRYLNWPRRACDGQEIGRCEKRGRS